jgi:hypothetical protein
LIIKNARYNEFKWKMVNHLQKAGDTQIIDPMPPTVENNGIDRREGGDEEENVREREME